MKIELDKIGRDCHRCANKGKACSKCERNVNLKKLSDYYLKKDYTPPKAPMPDDTTKVSESNRGTLGEWGVRVPGKRQPSPPDEQAGTDGDIVPPNEEKSGS